MKKMENDKFCSAYCGVACCDGTCRLAYVKRCEYCIFYKGCEDCRFDGTEYCIKEGQAAEEKQAAYWKSMIEVEIEEQLEDEGGNEKWAK